MGAGTFNTSTYYEQASTYQTKSRERLFSKKAMHTSFEPRNVTKRESCASPEHPDPTSIIIACDVTGSMGQIPETLLKGGLGKLMEKMLSIGAIPDPQVMFAAIGDTQYDKAPLQVTQFESDNRIAEQLKKLFLEGGGGTNQWESYNAIWYFAARKTTLDSFEKGKKGLLFTIGDELMPPTLTADHIRRFIDSEYIGPDIDSKDLLREVSEKYDVFHIIVKDGYNYRNIGSQKVKNCWRNLLGQNVLTVDNYRNIPERIVATVQERCVARLVELDTSREPEAQPNTEGRDPTAPVVLQFSDRHSSKRRRRRERAPAAGYNTNPDGVPHQFTCSIAATEEPMKDPVLAEDGFTYERAEITRWLTNHNTSPMNGAVIGNRLTPNNGLKSDIQEWLTRQNAGSSASAGM